MLRVIANGRTVWVKDLQVEKRQGNNGEYDSKSILFNFATDRNYMVNQKQEDGTTKKIRPTDFILCRANGSTAQIIADYCSAKNAEGKTISRHLGLTGHIETYQSPREFEFKDLPVNIGGQVYPISFTANQQTNGHILIVDEVEFLDSNPANRPTPVAGNVTSVSVGAPATTVPVQTAPVAQAQAPVAQAPVQQVAPQTTVAPQNSANTGFMNTPVGIQVPAGYTGEQAPF